MRILFKKMIFVVLFLLTSCHKSFDKKNARRYIRNDSLIIRAVLKGIPPTYHHLLVFPKDLCRSCFRHIVEHFEKKGAIGQVVLLGANDYEIKRLNSIYRSSLHFWKGDFDTYDALQFSYPDYMRGYVRYVEITDDTLIYKGKGKNFTDRILDVLHFYVKKDKSDG